MSLTMNIQVKLNVDQALENACERLGIKMKHGTFSLYETSETGVGLFFDGFSYPAVLKSDGVLLYDKDCSRKLLKKIHELEAYYGLEWSKLEASKLGLQYYEDISSEGLPQLHITIAENSL